MFILLTIIHLLICLLLILAVLLQSGKGGGLAGALGGGMGAGSLLGGRSAATFLSKATTILAAGFMISCLTQAVVVRARHSEPLTATERMLQERGVPAVPAPLPIADGLLPGAVPTEQPAAGESGAGTSAADAADAEAPGGEAGETAVEGSGQ